MEQERYRRIETYTNNGDDSSGGIRAFGREFHKNSIMWFMFPCFTPFILSLCKVPAQTNAIISIIAITTGLIIAMILGLTPKGFFEDAVDDLINGESKCTSQEIKVRDE